MSSSKRPRIISMDQYRGYTVAGMFLVNFLGGFAMCPVILKHHHNYCSYADTIMPQFLFAVGFSFRLTFARRIELDGAFAAYSHVVRRLLGLALISVVIYTSGSAAANWQALVDQGFWNALQAPLKRDWFQTLMHIAATSLWVLPVIQASTLVRVAYLVGSAALHFWLSYWFNFTWVNSAPNGIDGGPLGFLTWSIPCLVGTFACDAIVAGGGTVRILKMLFWSVVLMALGYGASCLTRCYDVPPEQVESFKDQRFADSPVWPPIERLKGRDWRDCLAEPPFVPPPGEVSPDGERLGQAHLYRKVNYWMMSQRSGTISYLTFSAGFSLALYVLFYLFCDGLGWQWSLFRTFGMNALAGYIIHDMTGGAVKHFMPKDIPELFAWVGFAVFFGITYLFVRHLEKNGIFLKM